jgi:ribosomal protein S6
MEDVLRDAKDYEIGFLARDEKGAEAVLNAVKQRGAEILLEGPVEKIALAYKIQHEVAAHFGYIHFKVAPSEVAGIKNDLAAQPLVLRSLIVTPPLMKPKPRWDGIKPRVKTVFPTPAVPLEHAPTPSLPLSNEALEKKIEEILK